CGKRRQSSWLEHCAITGGQCRCRLPASDGEWKVPGNNTSHHSHRLTECKIKPSSCDRDRLATKLRNCSRVELAHSGAQSAFVTRVTDRFAYLHHFQLRDPLQILAQGAGYIVKYLASFSGRHVSPTAFPGTAGGLYRLVHVRRVCGSNFGENFFVRRVCEPCSASGGGFAECPVDEQLGGNIHST